MPTNSYGFTVPAATQADDVPADMTLLAASIGPYSNMRFANTAARDALITAPVQGMQCSVAGVPQIYDGTVWRNIPLAVGVPVSTNVETDQVTTSTAYQASTGGSGTCEAAFVAPVSGVVLIVVEGNLQCTGVGVAKLSSEVRTAAGGGGSVVSGAAADDSDSLRLQGSNNIGAAWLRWITANLTPGVTYYARTMLASSVGTETATAFQRRITIAAWSL